MSPRLRTAVFLVGAGVLGGLLVWAIVGLPDFGADRSAYAAIVNGPVTTARHVSSAVGAVNFDLRAIDTLGEELILVAAAVGGAVLLRTQAEEAEETAPDDRDEGRHHVHVSEAVRFWGLALFLPTLVFGASLVAHGVTTPGGGFQGGVVLGTALLLPYLAGSLEAQDHVAPAPLFEPAEAVGGLVYVGFGILGLVVGSAFLDNVVPLGTSGVLRSGGMMPFLNIGVGVEVAAGELVLLHALLRQAVLTRRRTP
jgi:multicomponent Na+:H+ antiporter subunit B